MERQQASLASKAEVSTASQRRATSIPAAAPEHPWERLQHGLGNRALGYWIQAKLHVGRPGNAYAEEGGSVGNQTALRTLSLPQPAIQSKLTVNQAGDEYEQEADSLADQVMRMPEPGAAANSPISEAVPGLQRKCSCGGSCDACQAEQGHEHGLQRKSTGRSQAAAPPIVHDVLRSAGHPLDAATSAFMGPRFGYDFSRVRVHTDAQAAESARAVHARAYTVGHQIVFGAGQYQPATPEARRLIAHELTHVIQQGRSAVPSVQRDSPNPPPSISQAPPGKQTTSGVTQIDDRWAELKTVVSGFPETKGWITAGDAVVALLIDHENGYYKAIHDKDAELAVTYQGLLETERIAYRYVAWHAFYYQTLLRSRSEVDRLVDSFNADHRDFTGRKLTEANVRALKTLIDALNKDSSTQLARLVTDHPYRLRAGQANEVLIIVTSAADKNKREALDQETDNIKKLELTVEVIADNANEFLHNATKEGFWQAVEAVKEYIEVRRGIIDSQGGPDSDDSNETGDPNKGGSGSGSEGSEGKKKRNKRPAYQCNAKCQQQCPTGVEGWATGSSGQNCGEATRSAKSNVKKDCYPRHCNCSDTDGFRGTGHTCENHTR